MKKAILVILSFLAIFVGGSYLLYANPQYLIDVQLMTKDLSSPESDAESDLSNGIVQCYSINGFGPYFPGLDTPEQRLICGEAKEINIAGTSDSILSIEHGSAISRAKHYAAKYNKYVTANAVPQI